MALGSVQSDIDVLIPKPVLYRIGGHELRQAPLPMSKVLAVIRFVEENVDVLKKFELMSKPTEEGGVKLSSLLQTEVTPKLNELARLLLPDQKDILTDEWCADHLSPAHYAAFMKTALIQNQLWEVFTRVKGFVVASMEASLHRKQAVLLHAEAKA